MSDMAIMKGKETGFSKAASRSGSPKGVQRCMGEGLVQTRLTHEV